MRPSNKTWSLTVRAGSLHLDAPHGSFEVRAIAPEVMPVVTALPDGTDVECEGSFDGGGTITHLVVTKVRRILKDMSGRVMQLPDAIVAADGRLAAARARVHFAAGRIAEAARDVGYLLSLGDDQALGEFDRLPLDHQAALRSPLIEWQSKRRASWRALRHIPVEDWSDAHVEQALEQGLTNGGVFGAAPGIRVEVLLEELDRRKRPTKTLAKQTQRLRRAQATEGDTFFRLSPELEGPRVVGADAAGIYIAGTIVVGRTITQQGAYRAERDDRRSVIVHLAHDGRELARWDGMRADRVTLGVALLLESPEPTGVRLSDGKPLFAFANRIAHHDGELVWGIHERDPRTRTMTSEIRHIATGLPIATFHDWVDDVVWNAEHIFVYGASPQTLTREGKLVRASVPPPAPMIDLEIAAGRRRIPASHAPWLFGEWTSQDAGGWVVHRHQRQVCLAASEPGALWVHLEVEKPITAVELAPPWIAFHQQGQPILFVALAEVMSAQELRIEGKRFARRVKYEPQLAVAAPFIAWHAALVAQHVLPAIDDVERDAMLYRRFGVETPKPTSLARLVAEQSAFCIDHVDYFVDADDNLYDRLNRALGDVSIHEVERRYTDDESSDDDDDNDEYTLVLEIARGGRTLRRQTGWMIDHVMVTIDKALDELGAPRRLYALLTSQSHVRAYLVLTREQRAALVAAGLEGIRSGARAT